MKIAIFEVTGLEEKILKSNLKDHELKFFVKEIQNVPIRDFNDCDAICVFVHSKVDEKIIEKCKKLKLVCTRSTGTDHIDIHALNKRDIILKNVPLYGENTVAEHTFALMLSLSRKINESYNNTINGNFSTSGLMGFDLKGKTIGIIGGGRIGLHVARMARSFGMHVRVYDIQQDNFLAEIINFKYVSLSELFNTADIVTLHVPYNEHTKHIINSNSIAQMKDGAILINTARGGLVDTNDLIDALKNNKLYGAGLDVLEGEEYMAEESISDLPAESVRTIIEKNHELTKLNNVVITPHNAFNSIEAVERILTQTIKNIQNS